MRSINLSTFQFYYDVILGIINERITDDDRRTMTYSAVIDNLILIHQFLKLNGSCVTQLHALENPKLFDTLKNTPILCNSFKQLDDGHIELCSAPCVTLKLIIRCLCYDLKAYCLEEEQTLIGCDNLASELYHIFELMY
jgi:hypothetical protein